MKKTYITPNVVTDESGEETDLKIFDGAKWVSLETFFRERTQPR